MHETSSLTPELLLRHEAFVLRLARSLVRDEASARDVAQETLLAALKHAPGPAALRGWLARVVRHRASDLRRGAGRRSEREERAARPEAQPPASSAAERLELEHGVVRAVLELDEPYRGVVVAVYYEGLTPSELARRNGVAPGSVRAQQSRALAKLRAKLDREHGDRATWGLALVGLLRVREGVISVADTTTASGSLASVPSVAAGALAAAATLALGAWWVWKSQENGVPIAVAPVQPLQPEAPQESGGLRTAVELVEREQAGPLDLATQPATTGAAVLEELDRLLERSRQIRSVLLERRMEVDPDIADSYAWLRAVPDSGLVRLAQYGAKRLPTDLPWLDEESRRYSFRARAHDPRRHPQIELDSNRLESGIYGENEGVVLDLGEGDFRGMALQPELALARLETSLAAVVEHLRRHVGDDEIVDFQWLPKRMAEIGIQAHADLRPGHTYLVRSVSEDGGDVLVALEAAEVGTRECTLAWRILEHRPWTSPYETWTMLESSTEAVEHPFELVHRHDEHLLQDLEALQTRGEQILLRDIPAEVVQRFPSLANRVDAGFARLVDRLSPWTELPPVRLGGAFWSFARRSNDYNHDPDLALQRGILMVGFVVGDTGLVVDLGEGSMPEDLGDLDVRRTDPRVDLALTAWIDRSQEQSVVEADVNAFKARLKDPDPIAWRVEAKVGHSYLVRSMHREHDLLATFEVVQLDERGALIAWRILRTWPVPARR